MPENTGNNILSNLITIGAVALGWMLGETTGWIKSRRKKNSLKKALFEEIQDGLSWLKRNQLTLEKIIQITILNKISEDAPVPVPTHIYDKHFPEISIHLSRSERISYNSIYNLIAISHEQSKKFESIRTEFIKDKSKFKEYLEAIEASYYNVSMAIWQISFHIGQGSKINVDSLSGEDAKRIGIEIKERLEKIIRVAKNSTKEEIKENYYKS